MKLQQKLLIAFSVFILLTIVLGVWAYIAVNTINYAAPAPAPLPDMDYPGIEKESKVKVEQVPQDELDELLQSSSDTSPAKDPV